jgi:hypothetical protein
MIQTYHQLQDFGPKIYVYYIYSIHDTNYWYPDNIIEYTIKLCSRINYFEVKESAPFQ